MAQLMSLALILVAGVSGYYLGGLGMVPQAKLAAAEAARDEAQKKIAAAQTAIAPTSQPSENFGYWTSGPSMYGTGSIGPRPDFSMGPQSAAGQFASIGGQSWR